MSEVAQDSYFTTETFSFLRDLATNNDREWFHLNKPRFEAHVQHAALQFIADFSPRLLGISPHFVADPRPSGGSLFRIYRDVRFSSDKRPYKTHVGIQFRHRAYRDAHAPGFYLHLEPGSCFIGLGIWRPDSETLRRIRERIMNAEEEWRRAVSDAAFSRYYRLDGDSLKRAPKGYDPAHPLIDDLKRKDFIGVTALHDEAITAPDFIEHFAEACGAGAPFVRFLCEAVDVPY